MKRISLLLMCFACIANTGEAQALLGISGSGVTSLKDTVALGAHANAKVYIVNVGDQPYTGSLSVSFSVGNVSFIMKGKTSVAGFDPGDSQLIAFDIPFNNQTSNVGSNIVVIWPTGSNILTRDTVTRVVTVIDPSSISWVHKIEPGRVSIFPNPARGSVHIRAEDLDVKDAWIIDISGRGIKAELSGNNEIDISALKPGIYSLRLVCSGNKIITRKLVIAQH
jgi:hypothetical protein